MSGKWEYTKEDMHGYQRTAVKHGLDNTHAALFLDMGLGKTVSALTLIRGLLYEEFDINNALVVAPKRVTESVWEEECAKWEHLTRLRTSKIVGNPKQRKKALAEKADIYLISRDNIAWLCGQYGGSMLPFDMLVIDELSSFKNPQSVRFKALRGVQPSFKRVFGLTGTPAPNGLIDLWSQLYLLDRGARLGRFISNFRDNYFKPGRRNGAIVYNYDLLKGSEEAIYAKIGDICMSMKAEDYLELPGRIDNIIKIEFPPELQKRYNDFEREQVMAIIGEEGKEISALSAAALSNKLLQFANGAVYDADKNYHVVHDLKIEAVKEIIEDANGLPVLIGWTYRHDRDRLMKALKAYNPRELKTPQDILDWNSGSVQVMMMHPASGGHGLNLQSGGHILVWFGQTWSLELEQQLNARLARQGQKEVVVINKLVAYKTMDQEVIAAQNRKGNKQDELMRATRAIIAKYA